MRGENTWPSLLRNQVILSGRRANLDVMGAGLNRRYARAVNGRDEDV